LKQKGKYSKDIIACWDSARDPSKLGNMALIASCLQAIKDGLAKAEAESNIEPDDISIAVAGPYHAFRELSDEAVREIISNNSYALFENELNRTKPIHFI
jgi:hypothetical protein